MASVSRKLTAFLDGPDSPDIPNPIHSTKVARDYGFRGPLVGGVSAWGWCARPLLQALGKEWLDHGWADVNFRRPIYPGDEVTITVESNADRPVALQLANSEGDACIRGTAGLGTAGFVAGFAMPARTQAVPPKEPRIPLTVESAPVGQDLPPMALPYGEPEAAEHLAEKQRDDGPPWIGPDARIHPGWIAARMTPLLRHTYVYGPAIHTRSEIQHLAPARVGQEVTVAGRFVDAFERKGHHYAVVDGLILGEDGAHLARIRHTTIFRVARRD